MIPFLQVKPKSIRLKVSPRFPARLLDGVATSVRKVNGQYYIDLDYSSLPPSGLPAGTPYVLLYDPVQNVYTLVPASAFVDSGNVPATLSGTSGTWGTNNSTIINASGTFVLTLPDAAANTGRVLTLKSISAQIVNSASSNVCPITSATAGTAIFTATAGKWAILISDGTNWIVMAGN